jgi:mRNA-degrading endonuclease RelE of RelBE toxin-antitoxin system
MTDNSYKVAWSKTASRNLAKLYNIDPQKVFFKSKYLLSHYPHQKAFDIVNFPGFDFNGYYWTLIHNVVIIYRVLDFQKRVLIDAIYFANTEESAELFWGIQPEDE